jgi:hypothetical protein
MICAQKSLASSGGLLLPVVLVYRWSIVNVICRACTHASDGAIVVVVVVVSTMQASHVIHSIIIIVVVVAYPNVLLLGEQLGRAHHLEREQQLLVLSRRRVP